MDCGPYLYLNTDTWAVQRKCWWDGIDIVLPHAKDSPEAAVAAAKAKQGTDEAAAAAAAAAALAACNAGKEDVNTAPDAGITPEELEMLNNGTGRRVRVWARRVWTLELSLI